MQNELPGLAAAHSVPSRMLVFGADEMSESGMEIVTDEDQHPFDFMVGPSSN